MTDDVTGLHDLRSFKTRLVMMARALRETAVSLALTKGDHVCSSERHSECSLHPIRKVLFVRIARGSAARELTCGVQIARHT
jgi:hypothetical protein